MPSGHPFSSQVRATRCATCAGGRRRSGSTPRPGSSPQQPASVPAVRRAFARLLDRIPQTLWVQGELGCTRPMRGGGFAVDLVEGGEALEVLIPARLRRHDPPVVGAVVALCVAVSQGRTGTTAQLWVREIRLLNTRGQADQARARLFRRLQAEGLFDARPASRVPAHPRAVAVVTSAAGAAWHDVLSRIRAQARWVKIILVDVCVEGPLAPAEIVHGLRRAGNSAADVVLLVRGGGDLSAFDVEEVVRAVASSRPIITGLGHASDRTLTDHAADLATATPTAVAAAAVPDRVRILDTLAARA
jgi:exodeoxyribonuclease VII large subunit